MRLSPDYTAKLIRHLVETEKARLEARDSHLSPQFVSHKIECIKHLRNLTGLSLRHGKEMVELTGAFGDPIKNYLACNSDVASVVY